MYLFKLVFWGFGGVELLGHMVVSFLFFFNNSLFYLFIFVCWVFVSVWGLSLVVASGGHSSSRCAGLSLSRPLLLRSTGSRHAGSVVVAHGPSCSTACGIFPDQGSSPCPLHWQADSQPLHHQGSPHMVVLFLVFWEISILFSTGSAPIYIPTNSVWVFPFLHILANICYLCSFRRHGNPYLNRYRGDNSSSSKLEPKELIYETMRLRYGDINQKIGTLLCL